MSAPMKGAVMDAAALAAFAAAEFPQAPGYGIEAMTEAGLVVSFTPGAGDLRPGGTISGPALFALADIAFYYALLSRIGPQALAVTTSASIDFLRKPAAGAPLMAEARLLKLGRRLAVGDVLIFTPGEQAAPLARASMTYSIPPGPKD